MDYLLQGGHGALWHAEGEWGLAKGENFIKVCYILSESAHPK